MSQELTNKIKAMLRQPLTFGYRQPQNPWPLFGPTKGFDFRLNAPHRYDEPDVCDECGRPFE